jgi:hypothetical protein
VFKFFDKKMKETAKIGKMMDLWNFAATWPNFLK